MDPSKALRFTCLVATRVESGVRDGVFHGALLFVNVRAIGVAAQVDVGADVAEETRDLDWDHVPQLELANARRIDDKPSQAERDQARGGGRVPSLLAIGADFVHFQVQALFDRVQQRRFADAALSCNHAFLLGDGTLQALHAKAGFRGKQHDFVSHLTVHADRGLKIRQLNEVDFVDTDDGPNIGLLRRDQQAVDEVGLEDDVGVGF